jgi:hypothetical protein
MGSATLKSSWARLPTKLQVVIFTKITCNILQNDVCNFGMDTLGALMDLGLRFPFFNVDEVH